MKKRFMFLSILALTSLSLKANCGYNACNLGPCAPCATPCCYPSSWYVATRGAVTWHNHLSFDATATLNPVLTANGSNKYRPGGSGSLALGYNFQCICMRLEVEGLYQRNSMKTFSLNGPGPVAPFNREYDANGSVEDFAIMANLYYDFNLCSCLKLYVGAGAGVDFNRIRFSTITVPGLGTVSVQTLGQQLAAIPGFNPALANLKDAESNTLFAWNAMAGLTYPISQCWYLDVGYRIFGSTKIEFNQAAGFSKSNIPLVNRAEVGFRLHF